MIRVIDEHNEFHSVDVIKFSDGCYNVKVPDVNPNVISVHIDNAVLDMHLLELTINAYIEMGYKDFNHLFIPYIPNARADRVFSKGNAFPLEVTFDKSPSMFFENITVYDPHSSVSADCLKRHCNVLDVMEQQELVDINCHHEFDMVCSPDKGAEQKAYKVAKKFNTDLVKASKIRDVDTGQIISTELEECDVDGKDVLICDDICDGGGTFIPLAKLLKERGASNVILFVSHGIFAKGLDLFEDCVDKIYTANIVCNYVTRHDLQKFNMRKEK